MYCVVRISVCACSYIVQIFVIPWPRPCLAHEQTLGAAQGDVRHLLTSGFCRAIRMPQFRLGIYMICPYIMLLYIYIIIYYIIYIYIYISYIYIYITKKHVKFREFEVNGFKGHVRTMFF